MCFPLKDSRRDKPVVPSIMIRKTAVCQHWRNLALNSRSLWKSWQVPHFTAGPLSLAREIFSRSDPLPFRIQVVYDSKQTDEKAWSEHAKLFMEAPERIQALHLKTSYSYFREFFPINLPNLSSLYLENTQLDYTGKFLNRSRLPNLNRVSLRGLYKVPKIPIATLTHLSLANIDKRSTLEEFLDLLERLPLLEKLHLHEACPVIQRPPPGPQVNFRRVPLNALRSFAMREDDFDGYPLQLLHHLQTPSLSIACWDYGFTCSFMVQGRSTEYELVRSRWKVPPSWLLQDLTRMIIRKGTAFLCEVREDTISMVSTGNREFYTPSWWSRFLPNVQSLIITWVDIMDNCAGLLEDFPTLSALECRLESATDILQKLEREDDPWLPNLTQLTLWHDPLVFKGNTSGYTKDALAELGKFNKELGDALLTSRFAVRERGNSTASTFTVRLELGNIDRWEWRTPLLHSLLPRYGLRSS